MLKRPERRKEKKSYRFCLKIKVEKKTFCKYILTFKKNKKKNLIKRLKLNERRIQYRARLRRNI